MRCLARRCWRRRTDDEFCARHHAELNRLVAQMEPWGYYAWLEFHGLEDPLRGSHR